MASEIAGSWFPSGYYGHFRSKSRNDFVCEYRQLAKPQPPEKFYKRAKQPITRHVFSHHDNRHSFLNNALYFEEGLGRKRVTNSTYNFKPEFISWMPEREYVARMRPLASTYKIDFMPERQSHQLIVKRPQTSFEGVATTTYRYAHGNESPNRDCINAMNNQALMLSTHSKRLRSKSARPQVRETVASCLSWHVPRPPSKPQIPAATELVDCTEPLVGAESTQGLSPPDQTSQDMVPQSQPPSSLVQDPVLSE
ncbi:uncharacterized protein LOC124276843 [Haliotis rubra]|uniref:uncharacterized protein LOC124276843 n=1 Tax=Haliotis rubra TaxID=36100 RepID=UPI001EE60EAC|nr:uncharacterized protein LOC124276843 [Haliotis rubra]